MARRTFNAYAQDAHLFRNFANQVFSGQLNADWPQWSLKTQQVLDTCLRSAQNHSTLGSLS